MLLGAPGRRSGGGQVFFGPGQNRPDVLRLQVGTDNESHGALAADER